VLVRQYVAPVILTIQVLMFQDHPKVARIWRGASRATDADSYRAYLEETGLRDYALTPGNRGALALRRDVGDRTEWTIVSLWESVDAIKAFAGDDITKARFYPEDDRFLVSREERVEHWEPVSVAGVEE
jgi:heme-degrading monooxygenase HmoA